MVKLEQSSQSEYCDSLFDGFAVLSLQLSEVGYSMVVASLVSRTDFWLFDHNSAEKKR